MACLWAATLWMLNIVVRLRNRSSTRRSPTQSTTPTPTSDDLALKMMTTALDAMKHESEQTRLMALDLTQGRESANQNGPTEIWPTPSEKQIVYDYDSTPLSPGIEAVLAREDSESQHEATLRERALLQEQMMEAQAKLEHLDSQAPLPSEPDEPPPTAPS